MRRQRSARRSFSVAVPPAAASGNSAVKARRGENGSEKASLVNKICTELKIHTEIEEEIFYPAARNAKVDPDLLDEAVIEHGSAKQLIAEIGAAKASDPLYDARVTVLGEYIVRMHRHTQRRPRYLASRSHLS